MIVSAPVHAYDHVDLVCFDKDIARVLSPGHSHESHACERDGPTMSSGVMQNERQWR